MEFHPVASIFPLMEGGEFEALKEDIHQHGLMEPIWTFEGKILDGRNRYRACRELGIEPIVRAWAGANPIAFVWSENFHRRHLSQSATAAAVVCRDEIVGRVKEEARKRQLSTLKKGTSVGEKIPGREDEEGRARDHLGRSASVNPRYISDAEMIRKKDPEIFERVRTDAISIPRAIQEIKKREAKERLDDMAAREVTAPTGVYDVIVVDPPWPMQKFGRDCRPNQVALDYPTMNEDEIRAMPIPAAKDCHLWLWTTQKFLPVAFQILDAWGFRYVCAFVWHKPGGIQPVGLPQYNCEFALYARRGAVMFVDTKAFPVCFEAPRGPHSEKPEEFYAMVRRVTAGRRLDMFSRRPIKGFDAWGNEA